MSRGRARALLSILLVLLLGAAPATPSARAPAAAAAAQDGAVWALRGRTHTIYIAGSMHLMRPKDAALPQPLEDAYRLAGALVMEIDTDDLDPTAAGRFMAERAMLPPDRSLEALIGRELNARAEHAAARLGLPPGSLQRMEPWSAALLLTVLDLQRLGLDPALGVEEQLKTRAVADGKPISGLETIEFQFGLFDGLQPRAQRDFLAMTLEVMAQAPDQIDALTGAWRSGDLRALERLLLREYRRFPDLYRAVFYRRNENWVPQIEKLLGSDRNVLVLVGALHLVGDRGVIRLLERRGYRPQRLRASALADR